MKIKLLTVVILAVGAAANLVVPTASAQKDGKEALLVREAKITMAETRAKALARAPGTVEFARLERGKSGKVLFEFEIHNLQKRETEVHVDAVTGEVFSVAEESGQVSAKKNAMLTGTKVSIDDAEKAALLRVNGAVVFTNVERARGKVLYEFEIITSDGKEAEVHVDADTGQVENVEQD